MDEDQIREQRYILAFSSERNARYHGARRGFYDLTYRWALFGIVALGTAGVANSIIALGWPPATAGGCAAILGALSLVFNPYSKSQLHETLHRRSFELSAEIDAKTSPTADDIAQWRSKLDLIYAAEPPPMRALNAVAYNATLASRKENPQDEMLVLKFHHVLLKQFCSFSNVYFPRRSELSTGKTK